MLFGRPTVILVFDRLADALCLVAPVWQGRFSDSGKAIEEAFERIDATAARLSGPLPASAAFMPEADHVVVTPVLAPGRYGEMVAAAKDYIRPGDIFQVGLAQRFTAPFPLPPLSLYRALRRINPSPFLYYLDLPGFALIGPRDRKSTRLNSSHYCASRMSLSA